MALSVLLIVCLLPLLLLFSLYLIFQKKPQPSSYIQNKQLPPCPSRLPIVGNFHQLSPLLHQSYWQLSRKHGPVMLLRLGQIPVLVVSSAEAARDVLKVHDLACCSRPSLAGAARLTYNFMDVAVAPYGDPWRYMKKLIVLELLSLKRVQSFRFVREEEVELLISSISSATETPIDLTDKLFALTANITYRMTFGIDCTIFNRDTFYQVVHEAEAVGGSFSMAELFPFVGWIIDWMTGHHARTERVFHELDSFFEYVIDDHLNPGRKKDHDDITDILLRVKEEQAQLATSGDFTNSNIKGVLLVWVILEKNYFFDLLDSFFEYVIDDHLNPGRKKDHDDIIDILLRVKEEQAQLATSGDFTNSNIKGVLLNLFVAGTDTSAITLNWAMAELVRNPRVLEKVQDEVRNQVGNRGRVSENDLDKLEYLKMIIKETFRMHPAPLLVPRETISHCKINGYDIDPKTLIQVNVWAIGQDPKYWKEPEQFYPERFADSSIDYKGKNFELLPFGAGRRICPGIHMATVTIEYVLANLLYSFDWKLPEGMRIEDMNMEEKPGVSLTITKKTPLMLVPVKHLQ